MLTHPSREMHREARVSIILNTGAYAVSTVDKVMSFTHKRCII